MGVCVLDIPVHSPPKKISSGAFEYVSEQGFCRSLKRYIIKVETSQPNPSMATEIMLSEASDYLQSQFKTNEHLHRVVARSEIGMTVFPTIRKWCSVHGEVHQSNNPYITLSKERGAVYTCPSDGGRLSPIPWLGLPESVQKLHDESGGGATGQAI